MKFNTMVATSLFMFGMLFNVTAKADATKCANDMYSMITTEFDKAYREQGRPKVDFDNLAKVKDAGMSRLEANAGHWPKIPDGRGWATSATFSVSVLSDYVSVVTFCGDKQKKGEWRPN